MLSRQAIKFLEQNGIVGDYDLSPISGGANNRVYKISRSEECEGLVLKCYYHTSEDKRDRFNSECSFYKWLWSQGIRRTPEPIAWCNEHRMALFTYIRGEKILPGEIETNQICESLDFIRDLNASRDLPEAQSVPLGSEACFSLNEHLACVDRRIERLQKIDVNNSACKRAAKFIKKELTPAWWSIREKIRQSGSKTNLNFDTQLTHSDRCLSPSDFGFHNAIVAPDDSIYFFDFEYAGWDDPAKLMCDFFCQPEIPIGLTYWEEFLDHFAGIFNDEPLLTERVQMLLPAYQIKWCCIMLNEFTPIGLARRKHASLGKIDHSTKQLQKTLEYYNNL